MERDTALRVALGAMLGLVIWAVPCAARLVTVAITGEVSDGPWSRLDFFQGSVQEGDTVTGSYTYDTAAGEAGGLYECSSPPCGIILRIGEYIFQTDSNDARLTVELRDNLFTAGLDDIDRFTVISEQNLPLDDGVAVVSIELSLEDVRQRGTYHPVVGLLSEALPVTAPDLRHWPTRELEIWGDGFMITGRVNSVALVSGPPKLIHVDDDAPAGGDGSSWERAYRTFQDALADANAAEKLVTVLVAQGRYQPDLGMGQVAGDRETAFALLSEVTLAGGYAGVQAVDPNARNPQLYPTVLTGDLLGNDQPGLRNRRDNSYHVVVALDTDESAVLDGFIVEGGHADGLSDEGAARREDHTVKGGGLYFDGTSLTVRRCTFQDNYAYASGGGAYVGGLPPRIHNSTFTGNTAGDRGGGLYADCTVLLQGCLFQGNTASCGGAILRSDEELDLYLVNCTVADNRAFEGTPMSWVSAGYVSYADIYNSILWNPRYEADYEHFISAVYYSDVYGEIGWRAQGVLDTDPCFVGPGYWGDPNDLGAGVDPNDPSAVWVKGDYHLKSQAGHWDTASQSWVLDEVTSPCIDAGDPASLIDDEPEPNGARINMGAYGGAAEASKSYSQEWLAD